MEGSQLEGPVSSAFELGPGGARLAQVVRGRRGCRSHLTGGSCLTRAAVWQLAVGRPVLPGCQAPELARWQRAVGGTSGAFPTAV